MGLRLCCGVLVRVTSRSHTLNKAGMTTNAFRAIYVQSLFVVSFPLNNIQTEFRNATKSLRGHQGLMLWLLLFIVRMFILGVRARLG